MKENNSLFRKKSLDRATAPDEIDRYIKTVKPSVWIILIAIAVLLVGFLAWATFSTIETTLDGACVVRDGRGEFYIREDNFEKVRKGSKLVINDVKYDLKRVEGPIQAEDDNSALHAGEIKESEWYYTIIADVNIADGEYKAYILIETINPIDFILN